MSTKAYYPRAEIGPGQVGFSKTRSIIEAPFYGNNVIKVNTLKEAYELAKNSPGTVVTDMPVLFPGQSITETHEIGPGDWDFYADGWGTDRVLGCYALFSGWPFEKFMDNHPLPELKESKVDLEDVPIPQP